MSLPEPPLLVITDRHQAPRPLVEIASAVFAAGGRWLLLRDRDLAPAERRRLLDDLVALGRAHDGRVMVSADPELAAAAGAAGVQLPANGDPRAARARLGAGALIGISAHDRSEVERAAAAGADYATLSPVFASASKPGYGPALGPEGFGRIAKGMALPLVALGGVTAERARACRAAGAAGLAVMGAVMRAADPEAVVAGLISTWNAAAREERDG